MIYILSSFIYSYSLLDDGFGHFSINPSSGEISTTAPLDRETHAHYDLVVIATDGAMLSRSSDVIVSVDVVDENDNIPMFQRESYTFYIKDPTDFGEKCLMILSFNSYHDRGL